MATNTSQSWPTRAWTYLTRARWLHAFILVEIFFIGGGLFVASFGSPRQTLGQPVDPHLALGGLMGSMAIVFAFITLFFLSVSMIFRLRRRLEEPINY